MQGESETFFTCPYCFEQISMLFETYYGTQEYIEDCQVCCNPIQVNFKSDGSSVEIISIERA